MFFSRKFRLDEKKFLEDGKEDYSFYDIIWRSDAINVNRRAAIDAARKKSESKNGNQDAIDFLKYAKKHALKSKAQLMQDIFAAYLCRSKRSGVFLEFGATDGLSLSNTHMLEAEFGWTGVLAEPSPQWHESLKKNRPNTQVVFDCVWKKTGETLNFFVSDVGVLSSISDFRYSDSDSIPYNATHRNSAGHEIKVNTISINDLMAKYFSERHVDYVSIDTEGSEYEILESFDFSKYQPSLFTVEHNFTESEALIDSLMEKNGYVRVFRKETAFDGWYVKSSHLKYVRR